MAFIRKQAPRSVAADERKQSRDCAALIAQLDDPDSAARRWAARDLADCPAASAALLKRLQREDEISVREVILTTLTAQGDEVAVSGLVGCLRSEDVALRNEAIEAMKQLPDEVAMIIRELLADTDADVRIFAVNVLESLRHPNVETWLIDVISNDLELNVCATAVDLLGEVGTAAASVPLQHLKARFADEPYIQFAADLALKRLTGG
jgi:HEAT repeat protein